MTSLTQKSQACGYNECIVQITYMSSLTYQQLPAAVAEIQM